MSDYIELTDADFEEKVLKSDIPFLVDMWAPWCAPCRFVAPILEEISAEYAGKLKVGKVNVDDHKEYAMKFGVTSIPTLLLFKGGEKVEQVVGAMPKADIEKIFKPHIDEG
ncbi:thioredoxin [bacterium]|nr:thioredoxin [bacterium]